MPWLLLVLLGATPSLGAARTHLEAGKLDELVFDLSSDAAMPQALASQAARIVTEGAEKAQAKGDAVLALQLAQMAHRRDPKHAPAVRLLSELSLSAEAFVDAEGYADAWLALAPGDPEAVLLRAHIAEVEADWAAAAAQLTKLAGRKDPTAQTARVEALSARIQASGSGSAQLSTSRAIEEKLAHAAEAAARQRDDAFRARTVSAQRVVLYGTSWCGYCKKARAYFMSKGISFEDRDVEKDAEAATELAEKARAAGIHPTGIPVIDVNGTLVEGFNQARIDQLLRRP